MTTAAVYSRKFTDQTGVAEGARRHAVLVAGPAGIASLAGTEGGPEEGAPAPCTQAQPELAGHLRRRRLADDG